MRTRACIRATSHMTKVRGFMKALKKGQPLPYYRFPLQEPDYQKPDLPNLVSQEDKESLANKLKDIWAALNVSADFSLNSDLSVKSKLLSTCAQEIGPIPSSHLGEIDGLTDLANFYWSLKESLEESTPVPRPSNLRIYDSMEEYRAAVVEARRDLVNKSKAERAEIGKAAPQPNLVVLDGGKNNHFVYKGVFYPTKTIWHARKNPEAPKDDPLCEPSCLFDAEGNLKIEEQDPLKQLEMRKKRDYERYKMGRSKRRDRKSTRLNSSH